jgi:hypothetical protein
MRLLMSKLGRIYTSNIQGQNVLIYPIKERLISHLRVNDKSILDYYGYFYNFKNRVWAKLYILEEHLNNSGIIPVSEKREVIKSAFKYIKD